MAPDAAPPRAKGKAKAKASPQSSQALSSQRAKTSSERGRAFRERERQHRGELELAIRELQQQLRDKMFLRSIWNAKYLRSRHTLHGSLVRLVEEYYTVLRFGIPERPPRSGSRALTLRTTNDQEADPVEFLSRVTHPDAVLGDVVGPEGMIDQWRKYTVAHAPYETIIYGLDVRGPEENPIVFAQLKATGRITRRTIEMVFPHAVENEPLMQQLIGKSITYFGTTLVRFSPGMQIVVQDVRYDFISALAALGLSLREIDQLMGQSTLTATCTMLLVEQPVHVAAGDQ